MIIHPTLLSPDVLNALIESYVMREGTDYGDQTFTLDEKVEQIRQQLHVNDIVITFDTESESVNILTREEAQAGGLNASVQPLDNACVLGD